MIRQKHTADQELSAELFHRAADIIATWPEGWPRLLTEHTPVPAGTSRACPPGPHGGGTRWPCGLRALGELTRNLAAKHHR
jgi:hypothetical protein